jgi:nucleoside-diphosphate-sugar epimerase
VNNYLIIGGGGYIGSHLAFHLAESGYPVRIMDNFVGSKKENTTALLAPFAKRVQIVEGDVCSHSDCVAAFKDITHIIHLAAVNSVEASLDRPAEYMTTNAGGTGTLLNAVLTASGIKRVVFGSSCAVYGETPAMSKHEGSLIEPVSPYGCSKLAAETLCRSFYKLYGVPVVMLRFFNAYGPVEDPKDPVEGVVAHFLSAATKGEPAILHGNGEQTRDFIYIDDCIEACIAACEASAHIVCGHAFNVGTGQRASLNEVIEMAEKLLGRTMVVDRQGLRGGDIRHSRADITKAAGMLKFTARVAFEDGLARVLASFSPPMSKAA